MFFSFSLSAKGQTMQTTPLIEARQERQEISKRNFYIITPKVIIKTILIIIPRRPMPTCTQPEAPHVSGSDP